MKPSSAENIQWVYRTFADQLASVIEMMTGESPLIESSETDPPRIDGHTIFESSLNVAAGAVLVAAVPENTWKKIGERILAIAGLNDQEDSEIRNTFKEAVDQAISGVANASGSKLGREVIAVTSKIVTEVQVQFTWANIEIVLSEDLTVPLLLGASEAMLNALEPGAAGPPAGQRSAALSATADAAAAGAGIPAVQPAPSGSVISKSVDILLDVELPVSVSFGRAQLLLKDVLKLNTGSIIELNRTVNEPVEIVVNGSVIARGEVVVVEGNFGVRIQSVISRQERIRTLH